MQAAAAEVRLEAERSKRFPRKRRVRELESSLRELRTVEQRCLQALGGNAERSLTP